MRGILKQGLWTLSLAIILGAGSLPAFAGDTPVTVELNGRGTYYGSFTFDHALHEGVGTCADCHHHATGGGATDPLCVECHKNSPAAVTVACSGCHAEEPYSAGTLQSLAARTFQYHVDKPGLKGAMHRNCLGCHEAMEGPTGCIDCHERTVAGDDFYAGTLGEK